MVSAKAAARKIRLTHVVKFSDVGKAVEEINREYRRVEMLITDSRAKQEEVPARVNLPARQVRSIVRALVRAVSQQPWTPEFPSEAS